MSLDHWSHLCPQDPTNSCMHRRRQSVSDQSENASQLPPTYLRCPLSLGQEFPNLTQEIWNLPTWSHRRQRYQNILRRSRRPSPKRRYLCSFNLGLFLIQFGVQVWRKTPEKLLGELFSGEKTPLLVGTEFKRHSRASGTAAKSHSAGHTLKSTSSTPSKSRLGTPAKGFDSLSGWDDVHVDFRLVLAPANLEHENVYTFEQDDPSLHSPLTDAGFESDDSRCVSSAHSPLFAFPSCSGVACFRFTH